MPLFDFKCRACQHVFEALVRAGSEVACVACGGTDLERLPANFAASSEGIRRAAVSKARAGAERARAERRQSEHVAMEKHIREEH